MASARPSYPESAPAPVGPKHRASRTGRFAGPSRRPALAGVAVLTAVVAALASVPGSASADPRPTVRQVQQRVDALNHQAEQAAERYNEAREQLTEVGRRLKAVQARYARQQRAVGETQQIIGQLAAASYKAGSVDPSMQLLLSDDPGKFLDQAGSLRALSRRQSDALRKVVVARQRLAQDKAAVDQQKAQAAELRDQLAKEKQAVEAKLADTQRLLRTLKAEERRRLEAAQRAAAERAAAQRQQAASRTRTSSGTSTGTSSSTPSYSGPASGRAAVAVRTAYAQLGDPYVWGATGPSAFDCSGLTMYAWAAAGVSLPHSSSMQYSSGNRVSRSDLQPGDLVFYYSPISHVGIYIGGGRIIDAPHPGATVHITGLDTMPYVGAVRP